jgi:hypothetical protein
MLSHQDNVINYKWDPASETGYRLRFDARLAQVNGQMPFRVEDWTYHIVSNEWACETLEQALGVLNNLFSLDQGEERRRIQEWLPRAA